MTLNTDKAYLLGLIIGGGSISGKQLSIVLPFKKWGKKMADSIVQDIIERVRPLFQEEYGIDITFRTSPEYQIRTDGDCTKLFKNLEKYGFLCSGSLREKASISNLLKEMGEDSILKQRFLTGLVDSIGSVEPSHRRFTDENQIVSLEFKGMNYRIVQEVCCLAKDLGCCPDQVLWNHPNQHTGSNPYYKGWKKGFKVRLLLNEYISKNATPFKFSAKSKSAKANLAKDNKSTDRVPVCDRENKRISGVKVVHPGETDAVLPAEVRDGHFIHNTHFCSILGCKHAPKDFIIDNLSRLDELVTPFPILFKGTNAEVREKIAQDNLMRSPQYSTKRITVSELVKLSEKGKHYNFITGSSYLPGYPVTELLQGVAYVIAVRQGRVKGKRVLGDYKELLAKNLNDEIILSIPDKLVPLVVSLGNYSALVGPLDPGLNRKLIVKEGPLKYRVIKPSLKDFS